MRKNTRKPAVRPLQELIDSMQPELRRLCMRGLYLDDSQAACELLRRAIELLEYLNPVLLEKSELLINEIQKLAAVPVLISFRPKDGYYHQTIIAHLRDLHVASKTGIACDERSRWKSTGTVGSLATLLYEVVEALRVETIPVETKWTGEVLDGQKLYPLRKRVPSKKRESLSKSNVHPLRGDLTSIILWIENEYPHIKDAARSLPPFSHSTVNDWIEKACLPVLYLLRPDLTPSKQGRRKRNDPERTNSSAKRLRDKIVARIRDMVARPGDKSHF